MPTDFLPPQYFRFNKI